MKRERGKGNRKWGKGKWDKKNEIVGKGNKKGNVKGGKGKWKRKKGKEKGNREKERRKLKGKGKRIRKEEGERRGRARRYREIFRSGPPARSYGRLVVRSFGKGKR